MFDFSATRLGRIVPARRDLACWSAVCRRTTPGARDRLVPGLPREVDRRADTPDERVERAVLAGTFDYRPGGD